MSQRTLNVIVRRFIPFSEMTYKQQVDHLVQVHDLKFETPNPALLAAEHEYDHRRWDTTGAAINLHTHDKPIR